MVTTLKHAEELAKQVEQFIATTSHPVPTSLVIALNHFVTYSNLTAQQRKLFTLTNESSIIKNKQ
jgi:hypothetical protein